ncbi:MAG: hypothetical protein BWY83_00725 [bacterium ADurb.Bin478]|nr:MAG: hypothetical protein BWY83_00725 [bacterium ADurb.Bin478]
MRRMFQLLALIPLLLSAQITITADNESGYASNAFANYLESGDWYNGLTLQLNQDWLQQTYGLRLYYQGEAETFRRYGDRSYHQHGIGVAYYHQNHDSAARLQSGLSAQKRFHRDTYAWYEQQQVNGYANVRWILQPSLYLYLGATAKYVHYPLLSAFSSMQPSLFMRWGWFSEKGTTVLAEADFSSKWYSHDHDLTVPDAFVEMVALGEEQSLQGLFSVKVAQALTPAVGANVLFAVRHNFINSVRYLGTGDSTFYSDEELFDDVFGYHGFSLAPSLKMLFVPGWTLQLGGALLWKYYDQRQAVQLDGVPFVDERLREDRRLLWSVSVEKKVRLAKNWQPLGIMFGYQNVQNESNDPYYRYRADFITLGISAGY